MLLQGVFRTLSRLALRLPINRRHDCQENGECGQGVLQPSYEKCAEGNRGQGQDTRDGKERMGSEPERKPEDLLLA